ncbi:ferritin heavy chain-like [Myotis yumanensis]|uniref:ferritin heavy chain-like n=1 Tax=Myotis yumanensis TaxID=159337 RepID=UPI0038D4F34D
MGMIRPRRSHRLRPRRCPPRSPPLSPRHEALMTFLAGGPPPENLLPVLAPPPLLPAPLVLVPRPVSQVRQNYRADCEDCLNHQIYVELHASYVYLSIAFYFDRQEQALQHFAAFFLGQSREEWKHAQTLMRLQNQRGGRICLRNILGPEQSQWESGLEAMESALEMARMVTQSLRNLHLLATMKKDAHLRAFLVRHFLRQDVQLVYNLGASVSQLRKLGAPTSSLAESLFDTLALGARTEN